jgi:hypothetical protein
LTCSGIVLKAAAALVSVEQYRCVGGGTHRSRRHCWIADVYVILDSTYQYEEQENKEEKRHEIFRQPRDLTEKSDFKA